MAKARKIMAGKGADLLRDLAGVAGDPDTKAMLARMKERFGEADFSKRFTKEQKARILAAGAKFVTGWRDLRGLLNEIDKAGMETVGRRRGPRVPEEGEAARMDAAERKRIKAVLLGSMKALGPGAGQMAGNPLLAAIQAIPYEKRAVCYKELGLSDLAAEAFRNAAAQVERKDRPRGSRLREMSGDCYAKATMRRRQTDDYDMAFELPERVPMRTEAIREYIGAADLVRKTNPERAEMLEGKARREEARV